MRRMGKMEKDVGWKLQGGKAVNPYQELSYREETQ